MSQRTSPTGLKRFHAMPCRFSKFFLYSCGRFSFPLFITQWFLFSFYMLAALPRSGSVFLKVANFPQLTNTRHISQGSKFGKWRFFRKLSSLRKQHRAEKSKSGRAYAKCFTRWRLFKSWPVCIFQKLGEISNLQKQVNRRCRYLLWRPTALGRSGKARLRT